MNQVKQKSDNSFAFCYIILNGGDYLSFSLQNITNLMKLNDNSGIVIVEGADQFSHFLEQTSAGLSIDKTNEIIEYWLEKYPDRIVYERLGRVKDKRELRNRCIDIARMAFPVTHLFNIDGDELIKIDDFLAIDRYISEHPNKLVFWLQQYLFWGDFRTRYTNKFGGKKEIILANCHNFEYKWWHTQICNGHNVPFNKLYKEAVGRLEYPYYHYGHIHTKHRLFMKRLYSFSQLKWFNENIELTTLWNSKVDWWLRFFKGQPWENNHWAEIENVDLDSQPIEIKSHPWANMTQREIWDFPDSYPSFFLETLN